MMKKILVLLLMIPLLALSSQGKALSDTDSLVVWGNVRDAFNSQCLAGVRVEVMSAANSKVMAVGQTADAALQYAEALRDKIRSQNDPADLIYYQLWLSPGKYIFRFTCKGYAPKEVTLDVPAKWHGRSLEKWKAKDVQLQRRAERELGEAVVTATKVMMVHKGDTVVFNADYFQLAQGNMLDKLVAMLPGLEILPGGVIKYNGNVLSSLLVNGKDFFKGDASVALRNLPAYMVNTVKIYHKDMGDEYLQSHKDDSERKPNVLDVVLKKEYNRGWITNYELAGGPAIGSGDAWKNAKYLARLFALCFTDRTRLGIIGNFNNVNDTQTAGKDGTWQQGWQPENGVTKLSFGGLTFNTEKRDKSLELNADFKASHETTDLESTTSSTTFLPTGDVFNRSAFTGNNRRSHLTLNTDLVWRKPTVFIANMLSGEYCHWNTNNRSLSAQFDADPYDNYRAGSLDSLFVGPESPRLRNMLVNQALRLTLGKSQSVTVRNRHSFSFNIPAVDLYWNNWLWLNYANSDSKSHEHYDVAYAEIAVQDKRKRYFEQPSHEFNVEYQSRVTFGRLFRNRFLQRVFEGMHYEYTRKHTSGNRELYNLHLLPESETPQELGLLPSANNWRERSIDQANSYHQRRTEEKNRLYAMLRIGDAKKKGELYVFPVLACYRQQLYDTRQGQRTMRHFAFFEGNTRYCVFKNVDNFREHKEGELQQSLFVDYVFSHTPASISYLADVRDESDPLRISLGNAGLSANQQHTLNISYNRNRVHICISDFEFKFNKSRNDVAIGCSFNPQTGAYTYRPENVDGNWNTMFRVYHTRSLDSKKLWNLTTTTVWNYLHSVDLLDGQLSMVHNHSLQEDLSLHVRFGQRATVSLQGVGKWYRATSDRENYHARSTWDVQYGPNVSLKLPLDIQLSTDFNVYQRFGYDDRSMNDCDLVWNASLNWDFDFRSSSYYTIERDGFIKMRKRGGTGARPWTLRLTCHDLLQQLSNTRRVINAQGITETWYNAVPAYVMLSISYRFSKMPKK